MSDFKDQEIWSLLNDYDFIFDKNFIDDLICLICNKILQNASQNICGCRYCYQCIATYLNGEEKSCPKNIGDCKKLIKFDRDITIDYFANKKILTLNVKCPESFCQFTGYLNVMVDHIKSHSIKCPFAEVGCIASKIDTQKIKDHLNEESYSHASLLMESVYNLSNEINFLKENATKNQRTIEELRIENRDLKNEITIIENDKLELLKTHSELVETEMKTLKDEIKLLISDSRQNQKLIYEIIRKNSNKELVIENRLKSLEEMQEQVVNSGIDSQYLPFEWKIDNFLQLVEQSKLGTLKFIYSQSFYSHKNGYKMRLHIDPNGYQINEYTHLVVYFVIIEGEYDQLLTWPMDKQVTIALIDQISGSVYSSESFKSDTIDKYFKSAFIQPSKRSPNDIDYCQSVLINLNVLLNNVKLIKDKSIFLKCFVE